MQSKATTIEEYLSGLTEDRRLIISQIRTVIQENLSKGFHEEISYGMIGYVVPHSLHPAGYRCNPKLPLPFMSVASQKNYVSLYHMGFYGDENLMNWFTAEFQKQSKAKLESGKGCIKFKKMDEIPYGLIGKLAAKMTVQQWIDIAKERNL